VDIIQKLAAGPAKKTTQTRLDTWVETLEPKVRDAVLAAAVNPDWTNPALIEVLSEVPGFPVSSTPEAAAKALGLWRKKQGLVR